MTILYKSLVRSRLEYACPLWSSNKIEDIIQLEQIQRHFTSKITGYQDLDYWDRLKCLRMMSLQRRRERYCLLHLFKILNNTAPNDVNITSYVNDRRGLFVKIPTLSKCAKKRLKPMYDNSFAMFAP